MSQIVIRRYGEADRVGVVALWELVFPNDPARNAPERMIDRKTAVQPELFFVGEVEGWIVGTVLGGYDGCRGWVYHLAVAPEFRRRGFARALMGALEEALRAMGCPKVNLQVRSGNDAVVGFYESIGYAVEDRVSMGRAL